MTDKTMIDLMEKIPFKKHEYICKLIRESSDEHAHVHPGLLPFLSRKVVGKALIQTREKIEMTTLRNVVLAAPTVPTSAVELASDLMKDLRMVKGLISLIVDTKMWDEFNNIHILNVLLSVKKVHKELGGPRRSYPLPGGRKGTFELTPMAKSARGHLRWYIIKCHKAYAESLHVWLADHCY